MTEDPEMLGEEAYEVFNEHDMMKLFEELSFREKWHRVSEGLKQPKESGEHKWAKLQMLRLLAPAAAVVVPILMLLLITLLAQLTPEPVKTIKTKIVEPEPIEELEEIEEPEIEPIEPPEPTDVEMDVSADMPSLPSETITPPAEQASVQPADFDSVAIVKSPVMMSGILGSRSPGARGAALGKYGGGGTSLTVLRALRWLAKNQNSDGSWNKSKPAMTSLAVLAYLAHGDTPSSEEFGSVVENALRFLTDAQGPDGRFAGRDGHDYTQPICAYALAEAYGMTKNPTVKEAAVKALEVVVKGQNPSGGFNYGLKPSSRDDTSYMAWCVQALKAGKFAGLYSDVEGLEECMEKAVDGFRKNYGEANGYGGFGYTGPSSSHGLSGAGVLCMQFLGEAKSKEVRNTLPTLEKFPFSWEEPGKGKIYYWYYNTQAFFQEGGAVWDNWNNQFKQPLMKAQTVIGKEASGYVDHKGNPQEIGFWDADEHLTGHNQGNNPVFSTILCTLMLEVYYRYLPTFQQIPEQEIKEELGGDDDIEIEIVSTPDFAPEAKKDQRLAHEESDDLEIELNV
jgi:hypothetical protein